MGKEAITLSKMILVVMATYYGLKRAGHPEYRVSVFDRMFFINCAAALGSIILYSAFLSDLAGDIVKNADSQNYIIIKLLVLFASYVGFMYLFVSLSNSKEGLKKLRDKEMSSIFKWIFACGAIIALFHISFYFLIGLLTFFIGCVFLFEIIFS